jgi:hypothetical protein
MHGFVSAHNHCWLRNCQGNLCRWPLRNRHQNCFHSWLMDSSAHTASVDSQIDKENWVYADAKIVNQTTSMADAWICLPTHRLTQKESRKTESLLTQKSSPKLLPEMTHEFVSAHSPCWLRNSLGKLRHCRLRNRYRNWFQSWRMDSSSHTAHVDSQIVKEKKVAADSEIVTEIASTGDTLIHQRT